MATSKFARTATAQAAAPKAARKTAPRAKVHAAQPEVEVGSKEWAEHFAERIAGADNGFKLPSSARVFAATIGGLVAYGGSFYWGMAAVEIVCTAVVGITGIGFISFIVWFLGAVLAMLAALRIGYKVAVVVLGYRAGDFTNACQNTKLAAQSKVSTVRGWFTRDDVATA